MTKLKVDYEQGAYPVCEIVTVADDEEYWFENYGTAACSLNVGKSHLFPGAYEKLSESEIEKLPRDPGGRLSGPRLMIFNLVRVEVLE
jgi:hypothetical protein